MAPTTYKEIHLVNRPEGMPSDDDFKFVEQTVPALQDGEILLKTLYLSVDPYMRGRMQDAKSYIAPFQLNEAITGGVLAEVIASESPQFKQGDIVNGNLKWENTILQKRMASKKSIHRLHRSRHASAFWG